MSDCAQRRYVTLTLRAADAESLRPLLETRLHDAEAEPDPRASINAEGWRQYLELLDHPDSTDHIHMPVPTDVLYELARDGLAEALRAAADATERHRWQQTEAKLNEAQMFTRLLLADEDSSPWRR